MVWYSHLLKNFPQFSVIHTVKGFGIVNKAEIDVFLELSYFLCDAVDLGNLMSDSSAFLKSSLNIWKFTGPFHYRGLECKSRKSRDTWSNRQIWPLYRMKQGKG